jgi:signal transduction histidine kinase
MITEIDRVNRTITDLLTLSSPRTPVFREHSLAETLEKVVSIAKEKAFEKGVSLDLEKVTNLPGISYDGDMVHQAILNLVINGIEATPRGGRVKVTMVHDGEREIRVRVVDSGVGIDESIRKKIFDPFVTSKERGTGLGLSMVQRVVDLHRWEISISSGENKGTTFVISIPAYEKGVAE